MRTALKSEHFDSFKSESFCYKKLLLELTEIMKNASSITDIKHYLLDVIQKVFRTDICYLRTIKKNDFEKIKDEDIIINCNNRLNTDIMEILKENYKSLLNVNDYKNFTNSDTFKEDNYLEISNIIKDKLETKSIFIFPLYINNELEELLVLLYDENNKSLEKDELDFIKIISNHLCIALQQSYLNKSIELRIEHDKILNSLSERIMNSLDFNEVIEKLGKELFKLFNVDKVVISKYNKQQPRPVWKFLVEYQKKNLPLLKEWIPSIDTTNYFKQEIFDKANNIIINNIDNTNYPSYFTKIYRRLFVKSLLSIPIKIDNSNWGAIGLIEVNNYRTWTKEEIEFLERIAIRVSIAIKQAEMFSSLKDNSLRETNLRKDPCIVVDKNLASSIGLETAITYIWLKSHYYELKYKNQVDKNDFFDCSYNELTKNTYLSKVNQQNAINKLIELSLLEKKGTKVKIIDDNNLIKHYKTNKSNEKDNQVSYNLKELINCHPEHFSDEVIKVTEYFFNTINLTKIDQRNKVNKIFCSLTCRTFDDFIKKNGLSIYDIRKMIDLWFSKSSKIIDLNNEYIILQQKLKKMLYYRFLEARYYLSTDLSYRLDLNTPQYMKFKTIFEALVNDDK